MIIAYPTSITSGRRCTTLLPSLVDGWLSVAFVAMSKRERENPDEMEERGGAVFTSKFPDATAPPLERSSYPYFRRWRRT